MALASSRLTSQGQVSIPAEIRRRLGIGPGAVVEWDEEDGQIVVRRAGGHSSQDVHGALFPESSPAPKSPAELEEGRRRYARTRHARR